MVMILMMTTMMTRTEWRCRRQDTWCSFVAAGLVGSADSACCCGGDDPSWRSFAGKGSAKVAFATASRLERQVFGESADGMSATASEVSRSAPTRSAEGWPGNAPEVGGALVPNSPEGDGLAEGCSEMAPEPGRAASNSPPTALGSDGVA